MEKLDLRTASIETKAVIANKNETKRLKT